MVLARLFKWLQPGGRLLITDYCKAPRRQQLSVGFQVRLGDAPGCKGPPR
jgi:hypothetical protein